MIVPDARTASVFDIVAEPRGHLYRALIKWCASRCAAALVVVRDCAALSERAQDVLCQLDPALATIEIAQQWPGTTLLSSRDRAAVYRYELTAPIVEVLAAAVDGLYEWKAPDRPDDLCLLRNGGAAMLTTIAHERDAYLNLTPDEATALPQALASLRVTRRPGP